MGIYLFFPDLIRDHFQLKLKEDAFVGLAQGAAHLEGAAFKVDYLEKSAAEGNASAKAALPVARQRLESVQQGIRENVKAVSEGVREYSRVPRPPHLDIDKEGAAIEEKAETSQRTKDQTLEKVAAGGIAVAGGLKGPASAAVAAVPAATVAFSQTVRGELNSVMREIGVDASNPKALEQWANEHPETFHKATNRALYNAAANLSGSVLGDKLSRRIGGLLGEGMGFAVEQTVESGLRSIFVPEDPDLD